jgi:elongator complex protein 3
MSAASNACRWILKQILDGRIRSRKELARAKVEACKRFGIQNPPKNSDLLAVAGEARDAVIELLRLKPVRSISGVSVITVMPKPYPCPKSEPCIYCPGGPAFGTPQSYTGKEPAAARAIQHDYDPYAQVKSRIKQLQSIGHDVDKVELVIFGGTLTAYPREYLEWFVAQCLNAMSGANAATIEDAQLSAENATIRNSDIVIETRPDYCREPHVDLMLRLGITRVELGVQTLYDDIYERINRGHTVQDVADATRIARDAGFGIVFHLMPGLPGATPQRDLEMFRTVFEDERFRPDAVKIYPTLIMPGTKLYESWRRGEYEPYPFEQLLDLVAEIKKLTPPWIRIQRVQRDIPLNLIAAGVERGDMRSLVQRRMELEGSRCRCIRCREVGHIMRERGLEPNLEHVELEVKKYRAAEGLELFLSFEDVNRDILIGLLRLRGPSSKAHRPETKAARSMLVRELHVYGPLVKVGRKAEAGEWQHRGWGERLMLEAERISREEFDAHKIIVLSGIGTRNYYRRLGYEREGPYMVKILK